MSKKPVIAVIITTYNRPKALAWVLGSISRQSLMPNLVAIADDGSGSDTKNLVESFQMSWNESRQYPTLLHVWQPDDGFRAAQIRNKAVAATIASPSGPPDQIIFLDGDCIPLTNFVSRHSRLLGEPGQRYCVAGGRSLLNPVLTRKLENAVTLQGAPVRANSIHWSSLFAWRLSGKINRIFNLLPLPDTGWRTTHKSNWKLLRTCNTSLWRDDFLRINGFNEAFTGWGFEDSDLAIRLVRSGVGIKNGRFATNVLHLWHQEYDRSNIQKNQDLLMASESAPTYAAQGIADHLKAAP